MKLGWAILGVGEWVDQNIAPAIRQSSSAKLVSVMSRDKARAERFAAYHDIPFFCASQNELYERNDVDVVVIGTPNYLHVDHIIKAAAYGKHILCCPPLATTAEDCRTIIENCNKHGVYLGVDFQHRHHKAFIALKQIIESGELGDLVSARVQASIPWRGGHRGTQVWTVPFEGAFAENYSVQSMIAGHEGWKKTALTRGGGILAGPGMLGLDALRFVTSREVHEVYAHADISHDNEQETWVNALLRMDEHFIVNFECSRKTPFAENTYTVLGTKGRATAGYFTPWSSHGFIELRTEQGLVRKDFERENMFVDQIEAFCTAVSESHAPNASGLDGLEERRVFHALRRSALERTPIVVPHP